MMMSLFNRITHNHYNSAMALLISLPVMISNVHVSCILDSIPDGEELGELCHRLCMLHNTDIQN